MYHETTRKRNNRSALRAVFERCLLLLDKRTESGWKATSSKTLTMGVKQEEEKKFSFFPVVSNSFLDAFVSRLRSFFIPLVSTMERTILSLLASSSCGPPFFSTRSAREWEMRHQSFQHFPRNSFLLLSSNFHCPFPSYCPLLLLLRWLLCPFYFQIFPLLFWLMYSWLLTGPLLSKVVDLANHSLYGKQQVGYFPPFGHQVGCCRICALIGLWATNWSDFRNSAQFCCRDSLPFKRERRKLRLGQVRKRRRKDEDRLFSAIVRAVIAVLLASKVDGISSILASFPIPTSAAGWLATRLDIGGSVSGGNMFRWTVIEPLYRSGGVLASHIYYSSCHLGSGCHLFRCHLKKLFYTLRSVTHRRPSFFFFSRPTDIYCHLRTYRISSQDHKF